MIRLTDVEKSFDTKPSPTYVLRRINLTIQPGEFVTIMGPSGAGKSTLLAILGMLDGEYRGQYEFKGHQVQPLKPKQRAELAKQSVGFVFQQYHLLDDLTVAENLDMPLSYRDLRSSERAALVADALDRFHIVGKKDLYPRQLSGGQQQLIAVARAIIAKPALLLAGRADRKSPLRPGPRNHGAVLQAQRGRHHNHSGDPLGWRMPSTAAGLLS